MTRRTLSSPSRGCALIYGVRFSVRTGKVVTTKGGDNLQSAHGRPMPSHRDPEPLSVRRSRRLSNCSSEAGLQIHRHPTICAQQPLHGPASATEARQAPLNIVPTRRDGLQSGHFRSRLIVLLHSRLPIDVDRIIARRGTSRSGSSVRRVRPRPLRNGGRDEARRKLRYSVMLPFGLMCRTSKLQQEARSA